MCSADSQETNCCDRQRAQAGLMELPYTRHATNPLWVDSKSCEHMDTVTALLHSQHCSLNVLQWLVTLFPTLYYFLLSPMCSLAASEKEKKNNCFARVLMYLLGCIQNTLSLALTHEVVLFDVVIHDTRRLHIQHVHWCQSTTEAKRSTSQHSTSVLCWNNRFQSRGDRMKSGSCTDSDVLLSWVDFRSVYCVCFGGSSKISSLFQLCFVTVVCFKDLKQKCSHLFFFS